MNVEKGMILDSKQHELLKQKLKLILKYIHDICLKNHITYYAVGGTLLGAVRHKGMIPWDDDADIAMYRKDFIKFKKAIKKDKNNEYFLQTLFSDLHYCQIMPKIRLNGTLIENIGEENSKMNKGIFVDIFLLDYSNNNNPNLIEKKSRIHRRIMRIIGIKRLNNYDNIKFTKKMIIKLLPVFVLVFFDNIIIKRKMKKKYTMNYTSIYDIKKQTFDTSYYGNPKILKFDDQDIYVPCEYVKILESIYGDYMKLPPIEKRGLHHKLSKFNA